MKIMMSTLAALAMAGPAAAESDWREAALAAVQSEPKVVEAAWPNDSQTSFWVSVRDDGSRRDGYAEYLCMVLKSNGMPSGIMNGVTIHVWDQAEMRRGKLKELGRNICEIR